MTAEVKQVRPVRYLAPQDLENFPVLQEVMVAMYRNRVRLDIEVPCRGSEYWDLIERMSEFCDNNFTGYWSYTSKSGSTYDYVANVSLDTMTNTITMFFENEDDMALFLKDYAVLAKLGQA